MLERVVEIIKEQLNLDGVEITEDSSFKDDLGADSLDLFELVMAFEEEYGVEIPSEEIYRNQLIKNERSGNSLSRPPGLQQVHRAVCSGFSLFLQP